MSPSLVSIFREQTCRNLRWFLLRNNKGASANRLMLIISLVAKTINSTGIDKSGGWCQQTHKYRLRKTAILYKTGILKSEWRRLTANIFCRNAIRSKIGIIRQFQTSHWQKWGRAPRLAVNVSSQVVLVSPSYHGRSAINPDRRIAALTSNKEWPS